MAPGFFCTYDGGVMGVLCMLGAWMICSMFCKSLIENVKWVGGVDAGIGCAMCRLS